jgi:hypothetical protein
MSEVPLAAGSSLTAGDEAAPLTPLEPGLIAAKPGVGSTDGQSSVKTAAVELPQGDNTSISSDNQVAEGQQPALILSSVARARERVIARMVKDFMSFLKESVSSVLDDGCPFSELKPALLMYLANIASMTSTDFAEPYHSRLKRVEEDL